jgi:hypothetical protein
VRCPEQERPATADPARGTLRSPLQRNGAKVRKGRSEGVERSDEGESRRHGDRKVEASDSERGPGLLAADELQSVICSALGSEDSEVACRLEQAEEFQPRKNRNEAQHGPGARESTARQATKRFVDRRAKPGGNLATRNAGDWES